ncbi:MAG: pantoate--beta-alanine ligase [Cyclobacteriaceae bacterium]
MQLIQSPDEILVKVKDLKKKGLSIGLVPTMGALHHGHKALADQSLKENDITITSIFVNPTQFNNAEDLARYPKTLQADKQKLETWGVDILFAPQENEIYPRKPTIKLNFGKLEEVLEGKFRPGHFNGVGIIVMKFLNLVLPDRAYFGLKDFQQFLIVKELVSNFSVPTEIIGVPTQRHASGLAISSRNQNLSEKGLEIAANIYQGLNLARELILDKKGIKETIRLTGQFYDKVDGLEIEYFEIVNSDTLLGEQITEDSPLLLSVAGYVENIRLIDNLYLQPD